MSRRGDKLLISNRRARHDYHVLEAFECGIVLFGAEIKSLREGRANLQDAHARVEGGEVWLHGMHVSPYAFSRGDLDPVRKRKLLLHRRQIDRLLGAVQREGATVVPLRLYFNERGIAKLLLGLARGKRKQDKREAEKRRDWERERGRLIRAKG